MRKIEYKNLIALIDAIKIELAKAEKTRDFDLYVTLTKQLCVLTEEFKHNCNR